MRNRFSRIQGVLYLLGNLLVVLAAVLTAPIVVTFIYWGERGEGGMTLLAFVVSSCLSLSVGLLLRRVCPSRPLGTTGAMLLCALGWIVISAFGAVPFVMGIQSGALDAYFEAVSGFTTTGITVLAGLDDMPHSILFWRSLIQWLGGVGILSFFLAVTFKGEGGHHIFGAESHKIASSRPVPGLFNTVKILWCIYASFTGVIALLLALEGMPAFDAINHAMTALSTGGFSPHDASIDYYRVAGFESFRLIEYTLTFGMLLGGINFLVHYRVLTGEVRALWDNLEVRTWWGLLGAVMGAILLDQFLKSEACQSMLAGGEFFDIAKIESAFRYALFQVVSIITTTGFGTKDIGSDYFPALAKQLFLVLMVIGGCVGSTGGGIKVMRIALLNKLMTRELFRLRMPKRASTALVVDGHVVPDEEVHRAASLFFSWIVLLLVGGVITALFSHHSAWASFSGMFSALGNIGPCYLSVDEIIQLHPVVKVTYIVGMLAGRLELLPVLLLLSPKAWR